MICHGEHFRKTRDPAKVPGVLTSGPTYPGARQLVGDEKRLYVQARRALWDYEPLRASHAQILIEVQGRMLRLSGRVRTLAQKVLAEAYVKRLPGVSAVTNELIADAEVIRSVADALARDPRIAPYVLRVSAHHGAALLEGDVPDDATRRAAVEVAATAPLASSVRERLTLGAPSLPPEALTQDGETPRPGGDGGVTPTGATGA